MLFGIGDSKKKISAEFLAYCAKMAKDNYLDFVQMQAQRAADINLNSDEVLRCVSSKNVIMQLSCCLISFGILNNYYTFEQPISENIHENIRNNIDRIFSDNASTTVTILSDSIIENCKNNFRILSAYDFDVKLYNHLYPSLIFFLYSELDEKNSLRVLAQDENIKVDINQFLMKISGNWFESRKERSMKLFA